MGRDKGEGKAIQHDPCYRHSSREMESRGDGAVEKTDGIPAGQLDFRQIFFHFSSRLVMFHFNIN
jgi:hypothetical protein